MQWLKDFPLKGKNTFGIEAFARQYVAVSERAQLSVVIEELNSIGRTPLILGGGSNMLITRDVDEPVIGIDLKGVEIIDENDREVVLNVAAGENWHHLVMYGVSQGWGGIENLSLIPGRCGAAPMQNIGAYGVEIKEVLQWVEVLYLDGSGSASFNNADCRFGYRDSIFKNELKGKVIITAIAIKLNKKPEVHLEYGAIKDTLREMGIENPGIADVSRAVIHIRQSKLPDPAQTGNAGSFFKNPTVTASLADGLKGLYPDMPAYDVPDGMVKIPAAWLIEQCGWKGKNLGRAGCHARQPLVLINLGGATGIEILNLANAIQNDVAQKFGISLQMEVNII